MLTAEEQAAADAEKARTLADEKAKADALAAQAASDKAAREAADKAKTYTHDEVEQRLRGQGKAIKDAQDGLAAAQAKIAAFELAETERKKAAMTTEQRLAAEKLEAEQRAAARDTELATARRAMGRTQAMIILAAMKVSDAEVVSGALPPAAIETDADYQLTAAAKLALDTWAKAHPGLFGAGAPGTAPGAAGGGGNSSATQRTPITPAVDRPYVEYAGRRIREIEAASKPQR